MKARRERPGARGSAGAAGGAVPGPARLRGRPVGPGGGPAAGGVGPERAGPAGRAALARRAGPAVHPSAGAAAGGGRRAGLGQRHAPADGRDRRGDPAQRELLLRAGTPGRTGGGGAGRVPAGAGPGAARRVAAGDRGPAAGAGRRPADRGGRPDLRRRAADERHRRGGHVHAHRRVGPGHQVGRRPGRPGPAAAGQGPGVQRERMHGQARRRPWSPRPGWAPNWAGSPR